MKIDLERRATERRPQMMRGDELREGDVFARVDRREIIGIVVRTPEEQPYETLFSSFEHMGCEAWRLPPDAVVELLSFEEES